MSIRCEDIGGHIVVSNKSGQIGRIATTGRWPGQWKSNIKDWTASPAEMAEIGRKCIEIRRQVDTTRVQRRHHFQ
jgi:hypothetical protein